MNRQILHSIILISTVLLSFRVIADAPLDDELSQAMQLSPDVAKGEILFKENCSQCHGDDGWGTTDGRFPQIAGQHNSVIIKQLADIRAGNRDNPEMYPFARESVLGGPQSISDVAAYISTLPMEPYPEYGESDDIENAERLYKEKCAACHGANGEGNALKFYPLIQGQHYEYLLRQLIWIRDGKRRNAYPEMMESVKTLSDTQFQALADYVSQLLPPDDKLAN
ncbi:c-type cytochrome [Solemya velum gill symbiont]|uniref:Cytochrome c553 n=2 Tax=Solemya velum gill symbiont TaxID=2340 RepID=A0A0B0HDF9_SOVGS|nr:c-type cytochrome [Solemya velum gill symbiont]KHF25934.1 cytochrome c553 [Solemya velum gill symbiont]OOY34450.1 hypothetical protein BOV88_09855 [Solemya velum gill symbiont]OOY37162.1 hypothetical protein BOV89_08695 [Solemya velum gill symbiont]OOY41176.1 hypothetical protein BOV90_00130 [Solemya velum gill symbiont]OOY41789.1 hypothetical protein BOV91_09635 [Solemya velum gill symbiont]